MKNILSYTGLLLEIFSVFLILPIIVALFYNEPILPFITLLIISVFVGLILDKSFEREVLSFKDALILTAFFLGISSLMGAIPYLFYFSGSGAVLNSIFESVSGFTTTGLSVMQTVANVPKSILFWRSLTQWLGGIGIIVVFLSVLNRLRTSSPVLYKAYGYGEKIEPTVVHTTRKMLKIYGFFTGIGIALLWASGLPVFDSVCTALTAISTGGFTVVDKFYGGWITQAVVMLLMTLGSINFFLHDKLFKKRIKEFIQNVEIKSFFFILVLTTAASFFIINNLKLSVFELVSALTTTGYTLSDVPAFPIAFIMMLIVLMVIGGSSGSTAGGVKQARVIVGLKSIPWTLKKMSAPRSAVIPFKIHKTVISEELIRIGNVFLITYALFLGISTFILISLGYGPIESLFNVVSAQGTVGLSMIDLTIAPVLVKVVLIFNMFIGRLEIFPILIFIRNIILRGEY